MTEHFTISEEEYLKHYGVLRRSGRYPWGSGGAPEQNHRSFIGAVNELKKQGLTDTEIAKGWDISTTDLRALKSIARNELRAANISMAERLSAKGMSNRAIAERMGLPGESSVRALLAPGAKVRADILESTSKMLRDEVAEKGYVDVGIGVEHHILGGVSRTRLDTALSVLKNEGYEVINVQVDQLGTGNKTLVKVLAPAGTTYKDIVTNKDQIRSIGRSTDDDGMSYSKPLAPLSIDSKRVAVNYSQLNAKGDEVGGGTADGVIYVRPGKADLDLGGSQYAQVRIAVDGTHYLKGMAIYKDDLPNGVDLLFNTNKTDTGNKLDAMKGLKDDPEDPFGSVTRQIKKFDLNGNEKVTSVMNIVNDEGDWDNWSKSLASQMLSKQKPTLAKQQLDKTYTQKKNDLDEIMSLTNPAVRKKLLESYADDVDSSSVHLKAAAMDRQATQVILPVNSMKDTEIYAPNFRDGETVVLIRYPHGGTFEIPELTVNNRAPEAKRLLGNSRDAVGINHKVAARLSGADFDGDTVLVIPNSGALKIKSTPPLEKLKGFDPKTAYPAYEGMPKMTPKQKQTEMGKASNLITDMTIKGANTSEIAQAVRHSMVVIDAEKHNLNYKQSYVDNGIASLKTKYQGGPNKGASTLISKTTSEVRVPHRKQSYTINPKTGEKIYKYTGEQVPIVRKDRKTGQKVYTDRTKDKTTKSQLGAETKNAHDLSSGTPVEKVYADHANRLKALANTARKEMVNTKTIPYSPSAKEVYSKEVASLNAKLNIALKNAPLERQAQLIANATVKAKREANPQWESDELKKVSSRELIRARTRVGASKTLVDITDTEWEAIQAGAISNNKLTKILNNSDLDRVKQLATPRKPTVMTSIRMQRAEQLLNQGRTQAEVAQILGVPLSTLKSSLEHSYTEDE